MILIIKEKKPNLLDLMWKIKVNIITSCATLWNKMEEFWSTIFCRIVWMSHIRGLSSPISPFKVTLKHLNLSKVHTLTRSIQNLCFVCCFTLAIQRWACWCVSNHNSSEVELQGRTFPFKIYRAEFMVSVITASRPGLFSLQNI